MGFQPLWRKARAGSRADDARGPWRLSQRAVRNIGLIALGILAAIAARCAPVNVQGSVDGRPRLVDGDSFFIGQTEVRMQGIDAPEGRQSCLREGRPWRCGEDAKRTLQRLMAGAPIRCDIHSKDQHGRGLATCYAASGENLNARMVAEGFAVSFGGYEREEREAKAARRGIWASEFERPQQWRRRDDGGS